MKRILLTGIIVLAVGFGLLVIGCAKKETMQKAEEIKPPQEMAQPAPTPVPEQPIEQAKPAESAMPNLEDQMKEFEDQDIHFDFDRFNLKMEDREILDKKVAFMKAHPEMKIRIEGNCDERGTIAYNLALGDRRAKAAYDFMTEEGVDKDRVNTISFGKERPLDPGHNEEAWAKNRRDHFVITYINK